MRNLKRALSLALSSVMLLGMMVVGTSAASYPDVDAEDNLEAIQVLQILGVMSGDEKGNFNPDAKITRNEMAVIMTHLLNLNEGGSTPFTDVPAWAQPYVGAIYSAGVTSGTSATTYGGSANVTAVEAALMVMKALGYFGSQGEFGDNWTVAVVKQATKVGLFDGVSAASTSAITRSEAAQICLNALEATVTVVTQSGGGSIVTGDTNVNLTASYTYEDVKSSKDKDYRGATNGDEVQQLCEKLYGTDLKKNGTDKDDFGRVATSWTYKGEDVISANAADATYTAEVNAKTLYNDLGLSESIVADVYTDGTDHASTFSIEKNNTANKIGGNGVLVEAYKTYTNGAVTGVTLAVINTKVGEVEDIDTNDDDERYVVVDGMKYVTEAFDEDDVVLYTEANGEIQSMALATMVEEVEVTRTTSSSFVAGGTTYKYSENFEGSVASGNTVNLYVDAYGYVIKAEAYEGATNYAYVLAVDTEGRLGSYTYYAKLVLSDGTVAEVVFDDEDSTKAITTAAEDKGEYTGIVKYTVDKNDVYTLTAQTAKDSKETFEINKGETAIKDSTGTVAYANSKTLFLVETDDDVYTAYTGYANVPDLSASKDSDASMHIYCKSGNVATVVVVLGATASTSSDEYIYVVAKSADLVDDADLGSYYEYDAVVNGKITTIQVKTDKYFANDAVITNVKSNSDGVITDYKPYSTSSSDDEYSLAKSTVTADAENGTVGIGGTTEEPVYYALADDVNVFEVDGDEISTMSINRVDAGKTVLTAIVQSGEIVAIFVQA